MITLDLDIARQVKKGFHIHDPVVVTTAWDLGAVSWGNVGEETLGFYRDWRNGIHHVFVRDQGCVPSTTTLYHELSHVAQAERHGSYALFVAEFVRQKREAGISPLLWDGFEYTRRYNTIPYEIEANMNAEALIAEPELPLCYHIKHPGKLLSSVLID